MRLESIFIFSIWRKEIKQIVTPGPTVSFWGAGKLGSYFIRVKLYPLCRTVGSFTIYGIERCWVCLNKNIFKKKSKINHKLNFIYLFTCNKFMPQCVRKTVDKFRLRWNNYKMNERNFWKVKTCMQQHLFEHFAS